MVAGKSPEWLPPGFTEKVKYKNGRKIKYYCNVATGAKYHSKKDVLSCATADNGLLGTPETTKDDDSGLSSNKKVDAILVRTNDSPGWLPGGWAMEEKTRQSGSRKGSVYKVYTDLSSGSRFYSRAAVTRYLNTVDHANTVTVQKKLDNVDERSPDMSQQGISMTNTGSIPGKKKKGNSFETRDNVDEPFPDMSPQGISMTNAGHIPQKKKKGNSFETVATEVTAADDLPPGWIKEIKTSQSGNKTRKDPYYTDPVSGYVFRSKLDALRYLKTNDIGSCACRPKKRELDDLKLIKNKVASSVPADEQLSEHRRQLFPGKESNDGGESSGTKIPAESEAKILKQTQDNSNTNAEMEKNPEPANEVSKQNPKVTDVDIAVCSSVTDPLTKQKILESGTEEQTDRTPAESRKLKKRKDLSLPSRASKRLAGCEPEVQPNSVLNERSLRTAGRRSSGSEVDTFSSPYLKAPATIPLPSDIEPANEETLQEVELLNKVEKPPTVEQAIPDEQTGGTASEKQQDDGKRSQETQLCYDFGDSWSDPLEFALKTLRGEIPIDDTLPFPGCFDEQLGVPYNQGDGCLRPSQSDEPIIFQNEFAPRSESSKQQGAVDVLPANPPLFSALGNISFSTCNGFNSQSSTEAVKKDSQTKFNP